MIHITQSTQHLTWHIVGPQFVSGKLIGMLVMDLGFHWAKYFPGSLSFNLHHHPLSQGGRCAVVAQVVLMKDQGCWAISPGADLVISICPSEKSLLKSFAHFRVCSSFCCCCCCWIVGTLYIFWILVPYQIWGMCSPLLLVALSLCGCAFALQPGCEVGELHPYFPLAACSVGVNPRNHRLSGFDVIKFRNYKPGP